MFIHAIAFMEARLRIEPLSSSWVPECLAKNIAILVTGMDRQHEEEINCFIN